MIGIILAAGQGRRLLPLTEDLPKTLLPISGERSILELGLDNLATVGITEVSVVVGHAAERVEAVLPGFAERYGLTIETVLTEHAAHRNNAYSLWRARSLFERGALVVNGDTVHPPVFLEQLLAAAAESPDADLVLAIDAEKPLAEEEMKVSVDDGHLRIISKLLDPVDAFGEFIGISIVTARGAERAGAALAQAWNDDPNHYYEDAYQLMADERRPITLVPVSGGPWVEVDDHADLARARALT